MHTELPPLTVIIATYERPLEIARLMTDLRNQENSPPFDVIICDDGSCDETLQTLKSLCHTHSAMLLTQVDKGFRVACARNMGIRRAQHEVAVFLDDDVRVLPGFLGEHSRMHAHASDPVALIGARLSISKLSMMANTATLERLMKVVRDDRESKYGISFSDDRPMKARCPWKVFYGCNTSVRVSHLRTTGGFDESFVGYGLEDNELAYRLFKLGIKFILSDRIPVFHEEAVNPRDPYKNALRGSPADFSSYVENAKRFMEKHRGDPQVQRVLSQALTAIDEYMLDNNNRSWSGYRISI